MPNDCPCLSDLYCCACGTPCIRQEGGHVMHPSCVGRPVPAQPPPREPQAVSPPAMQRSHGPAVAHIPPEQQAALDAQAEEQGITF